MFMRQPASVETTHFAYLGGQVRSLLSLISYLGTGEYQDRAHVLGAHMHERLASMVGRGAIAVRRIVYIKIRDHQHF